MHRPGLLGSIPLIVVMVPMIAACRKSPNGPDLGATDDANSLSATPAFASKDGTTAAGEPESGVKPTESPTREVADSFPARSDLVRRVLREAAGEIAAAQWRTAEKSLKDARYVLDQYRGTMAEDLSDWKALSEKVDAELANVVMKAIAATNSAELFRGKSAAQLKAAAERECRTGPCSTEVLDKIYGAASHADSDYVRCIVRFEEDSWACRTGENPSLCDPKPCR